MSDQHQESKGRTVALVLDPGFGEQVGPLAKKMPVWIVESQINTEVVSRIRKCSQDVFEITVFCHRTGESKKEQFVRALYGLDEHQGKTSIPGGYQTLLIYSVSRDEIDLQILKELEFDPIEQTSFGWRAHRN